MPDRIADSWRLALDVGPLRHEPAGVGAYVSGLASGLARLIPDRVSLIGVRPDALLSDAAAGLPQSQLRGHNYHGWLQLFADADARRTGASIAHFTNAAAPLLTRLPFVLTVHDLSVLRMPRLHPQTRVATTPVMLAAVARAAAIIVPSDWTAR